MRQWRAPSTESLVAILRALGAEIDTAADASNAVRARRLQRARTPIEPVLIAWDGRLPRISVRLPNDRPGTAYRAHFFLEAGEELECRGVLEDAGPVTEVEGERFKERLLSIRRRLPPGYHALVVEVGGQTLESSIISAPSRAFEDPRAAASRDWGVFLPLYALRSASGWGAGSYRELGDLIDWVGSLGGSVAATLPLLASGFDGSGNSSPYAPVSRLLWSEFFVDPLCAPEFGRSVRARELVASRGFQERLAAARTEPLVHYDRVMGLRRPVLSALAETLFAEGSNRLEQLQRFLAAHPVVEDYAAFRAVWEAQARPWPAWPEPLRQGSVTPAAYDEGVRRYYLYAQWLAHEQLGEVAARRGRALYLDLPLGVHPDGYDAWRERALFAPGVSAGAPPDGFFLAGQDWGFRPMLPEALRAGGYRYLARVLQHHMIAARILRVDHVMGLHRLFWIPPGGQAREGTYVRYSAGELYAVLCLESVRHRTQVVGENLGTVPRYVNPAMDRHNVKRMYVAQYEVRSDKRRSLGHVPAGAVAALNTHDMVPFAGWWQGLDVKLRERLGLLDPGRVEAELSGRAWTEGQLVKYVQRFSNRPLRAEDVGSVLRALLRFLAASPAGLVLVNLEDLWLETQPQNVPGTWREEPNWRRKAALEIERFTADPEILEILRDVDAQRKKAQVHR